MGVGGGVGYTVVLALVLVSVFAAAPPSLWSPALSLPMSSLLGGLLWLTLGGVPAMVGVHAEPCGAQASNRSKPAH